MAKRQKTERFSIQSYDNQHYQSTEQYAKAVGRLFDAATEAIAKEAAKGTYDPDKAFSFTDYPKVKSAMQDETKRLASKMTSVIESGSKKQWLYACDKNDDFIDSIMDTSKLSKSRLEKMQDRNLDALQTFQTRKVNGLDLSGRVWKYVDQYREQIEDALDVGLGEGRSAQQLARDVRQNLNDPDRLFRRVRDKRGNLQLSKNAAAYHPGRGVYRSSVKNAQRLARSEINMAYRQSDYERWQALDFVVGFEIKRSNHVPLCDCDLCRRLVGQYPKEFKFVGWHPQCMCYAIPVLMDEETFDDNELGDLKAALQGRKYDHKAARNTVIDVPQGFKDWVAEHADSQKNWASTPYFIRDNFKDGQLSKGLKFDAVTVGEQVEKAVEVTYKSYKELSTSEQISARNQLGGILSDVQELERACNLYGVDYSEFERLRNEIWPSNSNEMQYWRTDELQAAKDRLVAKLNTKIAQAKTQAEKKFSDFKAGIEKSREWVDVSSYERALKNANDMFADEAKQPYPNYMTFVNAASISTNTIDNDVARIQSRWEKAKADANAIIANSNGKDVSKLQELVAKTPSSQMPAEKIAEELKKAINDVKKLSSVVEDLKNIGIDYLEVKKFDKQPTEQEIIDRVGGGDMTRGSCASLAFTYAANKGGYDVLDFRGGKSLNYFSRSGRVFRPIEGTGCIKVKEASDYTAAKSLMANCVVGKQYLLSVGKHCAVIRKTDKGLEYLELQTPNDNGWTSFGTKQTEINNVLKQRFGCLKSHSFAGMKIIPESHLTDIDTLLNDPAFAEMMGYINTASDKQKKGKAGSAK